jgi:hypothetical protein
VSFERCFWVVKSSIGRLIFVVDEVIRESREGGAVGVGRGGSAGLENARIDIPCGFGMGVSAGLDVARIERPCVVAGAEASISIGACRARAKIFKLAGATSVVTAAGAAAALVGFGGVGVGR